MSTTEEDRQTKQADQEEFSKEFLRSLGKRPSWHYVLFSLFIIVGCLTIIGTGLYLAHELSSVITESIMK